MGKSWFPYNTMPSQAQERLFCFGHSGSTASIFRGWQPYFSNKMEICPVQLPGRETRFSEPLIYSMNVLIEELWPALLPLTDVPFSFFGHSLGALIAFELAKKVESTDIKSRLKKIIVSACSAPALLQSHSSIHTLPEDAFVECLKSYGAMPQSLLDNKEALRVIIPRVRADFSIFETYSFDSLISLTTPMVACAGHDDPIVPKENVQAWERHTLGQFNFHIFPGDHFYLGDSLSQLSEFILNARSC